MNGEITGPITLKNYAFDRRLQKVPDCLGANGGEKPEQNNIGIQVDVRPEPFNDRRPMDPLDAQCLKTTQKFSSLRAKRATLFC